MFPSLKISIMKITFLIHGSVICQIILNLDAPSISAASYSDMLIPDIAAMYTIADHPLFFHTSVPTIIPLNHSGDDKNGILVPKFCFIYILIRPSASEKRATAIPYTITHDKKYGK